jgi:hypothetical protein
MNNTNFKIDEKDIEAIIKERTEPANGSIGNDVLYKMCKEYPLHNNANEVHSKLWLIGSAYSATLERNKIGKTRDKIFFDVVKEITKHNKELDKMIKKLKPITDGGTMIAALETHFIFMDIFASATEQNKRSLASKYLHFHRPNVFYIYDSNAKTALTKLVKGSVGKISESCDVEYDAEYAAFCAKAHYLRTKINKERDEEAWLTVREFDSLLLKLYKSDKPAT